MIFMIEIARVTAIQCRVTLFPALREASSYESYSRLPRFAGPIPWPLICFPTSGLLRASSRQSADRIVREDIKTPLIFHRGQPGLSTVISLRIAAFSIQ